MDKKITEKFAKEFDEKCATANLHGFFNFLQNNSQILAYLSEIGRNIITPQTKPDRVMPLDEKTIKNVVQEFYETYLPQKANEVQKILNGTHPLFIDEKGNANIDFTTDTSNQSFSYVKISGKNLELNVFIKGLASDLRITAHEIAHALSSHHQYLTNLLQSNASAQEIDEYKRFRGDFQRDCIGEIESHIVERLFNDFSVKKGIYSQNDIDNYEQQEQNKLLGYTNLIREEFDIIKQLPCPVTYENLVKLVQKLQKDGQERLLERIKIMHDNQGEYSANAFRYVVGKIVAKIWMQKFTSLKNSDKKAEMLNNFQSYLDKTHLLSLDSACKELLGQDYIEIIKNFNKKD